MLKLLLQFVQAADDQLNGQQANDQEEHKREYCQKKRVGGVYERKIHRLGYAESEQDNADEPSAQRMQSPFKRTQQTNRQ